MLYNARPAHIFATLFVLAACTGNGGDNPDAASRIEGQEKSPTVNAGENLQAPERSTVTLTAQVQASGNNTVLGYAWFPSNEDTVFFGESGRSDEAVLDLVLPQVEKNTPVLFTLQVQFSDGSVLEDQVQINIQNTFDNALPLVNAGASPVGSDNRLTATSCESVDPDGALQTYQWRNETLNIQYEETSCNLSVQLPNSPESQTYTLRAIAIDNDMGLGFKLFDVTTPARASNTAPVIQNATALPEPVRPGETLNLTVEATDADGDPLFYRWTQTGGANVPLSNSNQAEAQAQIPADLADQTLTFSIEVSDRQNFQAGVAQRAVNASVRSTSNDTSELFAAQQPSAGQCTPFYGAGLKGQGYAHLLGAMHEHTAYSDGQANTDPLQVYQQTRERGMNFVMSSDHSDNLSIPLALPDPDNCLGTPLSCLISDPDNLPNSLTKWQTTLAQADQVTAESGGKFTAMRGFEWTSDRFGHANVYLSTNNINAKTGPGYAVSMDLFWQWFVSSSQLGGGDDGILVFNHPGREDALHSVFLQIGEGVGQATRMAGALNALNVFQQGDSAYAFNDFKYVPAADYRVVGVEVFGKGSEYDTDGKSGSWYGHALDKGWYLGPVGSEDHHSTDWGGSSLPKTVLIARSNNQADIREAFLARRFYTVAQNENALRMNFEAAQANQRMPMGSRIGTRNNRVQFEFNVDSANPMDPLQGMVFELFSSQSGPASNAEGRYVQLQTRSGKAGRFTVTPAEGKNWYFLRVKRGDRIVAVSAPIWVFKGSDPLPECTAG
ncbi:MAG: hypothetical protein KJ798_12540 [Gammaproteobacteria bacterium]|nr:hypothetical protein [Gammaproteobacteria bacterium]MBU0849885.1 hypothetical protein [Gammaproteobacteria bacterium]MBU1781197.1 hypothetical protein [Gammaproteobacteria bacterium]MBU2087120.1 hypothetical protein [Gammaproteobacteria bacterium]MBU2128344.1 hypothetical protein [Gammaproteobacteria bacterium]